MMCKLHLTVTKLQYEFIVMKTSKIITIKHLFTVFPFIKCIILHKNFVYIKGKYNFIQYYFPVCKLLLQVSDICNVPARIYHTEVFAGEVLHFILL
jgi:predicted membrane channel-forming protein YqfA (hemolysin III family)